MHNPINPIYQNKEVLATIRQQFKTNKELPSVALGGFLEESEVLNLRALSTRGWTEKYLPDRYRFEERSLPSPEERELKKLLQAFVKQITGKQPLAEPTRRLRHESFTVLHDKEKQKPGVVAYLFLADWDRQWGGQIVFTRKGETLASFTPHANTLLIVERTQGAQSFIKYVNHKAGQKAIVIISA